MTTSELFYENKLRTRVSGLCYKNDKILLVKHNLKGKSFYAPPGGAIEFGESATDALKRELEEETTLAIKSFEFKFITEYVNPPLHAIELFYHIKTWHGIPTKGTDPETNEIAIIEDVNYYSISELNKIKKQELHHVLHKRSNPLELLSLAGFIHSPKIIC